MKRTTRTAIAVAGLLVAIGLWMGWGTSPAGPIPVPLCEAPPAPECEAEPVASTRQEREFLGAGGLGVEGTGQRSRGSGTGLFGLGTRGIGGGSGGYGSGGGNFGARGSGGIGVSGGDVRRPPSGLPLSKDWQGWPENDFDFVDRDFLATFSVDVDTGSYSQARRILRGGQVPPPEAVRSEEFVNYQKYAYPEPEDGVPFSVTMEAAPHPWLDGHHVLRVGLRGASAPATTTPVHLTFLVDTSCSMRGDDRLPMAKRALKLLVEGLEPEDTVALVTYAGDTRLVLEATSAAEVQPISVAIDALTNGGGTAMESGMQLAYATALAGFVPGHENRVIVLSDGDANIGASAHGEILESLEQYARQGITLSTVGFGAGNYRDHLMEQLADKGDGNYVYIDSMEEARRVFSEDLGAMRTIARDVKIQVTFDRANVYAYKLMGYENRVLDDDAFRDDTVDAAEVGTGHTVTALFDLILRKNRSGSLASVGVRHKTPGPDAPSREYRVAMPAIAVAPSFDEASQDLRLALAAATFAMKLRNADELIAVTLGDIADLAASGTRADGDRDEELVELVRIAANLEG